MNMDISENLRIFRELLTCVYDLYSWVYDPRGTLVYSNCENEAVFSTILMLEQDDVLFSSKSANTYPIVLTNSFGLMWLADFERDGGGNTIYVHLIGPTFYDDMRMRSVEAALDILGLSLVSKRDCIEMLGKLPVISALRFFEYGVMLHYCLCGEKITMSEFGYAKSKKTIIDEVEFDSTQYHGTWAMEQAILKLIEDGNLDYAKQLHKLGSMGHPGILSDGDTIRHLKNQNIIFTALCTRAAIKGGLSPEIAYTISDFYILKFEACNNIEKIVEFNRKMADDFVYRIHRIKAESGISPEIQKCCDYIQLNMTGNIEMSALARLVGYNENYLSQKFSKEMKLSLTEYIAMEKIERAKHMLVENTLSIQEIGECLGYSTPSYFGRQFRKLTGFSPSEYKSRLLVDGYS